jgi:NADH-quinone oxidoreductase subunit I
MTVKVTKVHRPDMDLPEKLFIKEIVKGMITTNRHFWRNWIRRKDTATLDYPNEKRDYSARWRGLHRLMHREDGSVRCVACMMCSTHCPAKCITIVAGEHEDPAIEKVPVTFEIDLLKCIFCGMCEEACPCDAIRLDTGVHAPPVYSRGEAQSTKEDLLARGGPSVARQGGKSA